MTRIAAPLFNASSRLFNTPDMYPRLNKYDAFSYALPLKMHHLTDKPVNLLASITGNMTLLRIMMHLNALVLLQKVSLSSKDGFIDQVGKVV